MRMVETKEVIHGLHFSCRNFRDVTDAGEWLATHHFSVDEDFSDEQVAEALEFVRAEQLATLTAYEHKQAEALLESIR